MLSDFPAQALDRSVSPRAPGLIVTQIIGTCAELRPESHCMYKIDGCTAVQQCSDVQPWRSAALIEILCVFYILCNCIPFCR